MSVRQAEIFEEQEEYQKAYEEYLNAYSSNPKDLNVLERLGHNALLLGKKEDAAKFYNEMLQLDATNVMVYEELMNIYIQTDKYKYYICRGNLHSVQQQYEHAINDYKKALNHTQEDGDIMNTRFVLATLYEQRGENLKAIDEYLKLLNYENVDEVVYVKLANVYMKDSMIPSAIETLERAISKGHNSDNIKENLANLYIKEGLNDKALEITNNELTEIKCLLGLERFNDAKSKLDELSDKYSQNPTYLSLAAEYYFATGDFDKALEYVDKFDNIQQNSPLTYQMRALIYESKDDSYRAHVNWAKYNILRGNKDIAINEYLNAYQVKNDDATMISSLATLLEDSGDKNHAMEMYERLVQLDDTDKIALQKLAEFRESIGDYKTQADYLEKLVEIDKRNFQLILKLAQLYERLKNKPDAVAYYKKYLSIAPINEETEKIKIKLDTLENTAMEEDEGLVGAIMKIFSKR